MNDENQKEQGLTFSNFSAHGSMEVDGLLIARDISFTLAGVKINNIRLLVLNQETREFESLFFEKGGGRTKS